jgi:hypothetical protein
MTKASIIDWMVDILEDELVILTYSFLHRLKRGLEKVLKLVRVVVSRVGSV